MIGKFLREMIIVFGALLRKDDRPKVVFYHDVGKKWTPMGTDEEVFWRHMKALREGDIVCFDDGFRGVWDERENFHEVHQKKIVFIAVALVGRAGYLNWDEIRVLRERYGLDFQCHTWSHQTLTGPYNDEVPEPANGRTEEWYRHELVDSKAELERQIGARITGLCLPVGHYSDEIIERCRIAGYCKVYASYPGDITDDYIQPRCLAQDLSLKAFKALLCGGMNILSARYRSRHCFEA